MKYTYQPQGTCSRLIEVELDGDIVKSVKFTGGCAGNTQGVAALATGRKVSELVPLLQGIKCGSKPTSCPAQLAEALAQGSRVSKL